MELTTIFFIGSVVLLAIFVLIIRLAVRWAIRITILAVIFVALVGGALFLWWTSRLAARPQQKNPRPAPTRRATSH
jgi:hypothetical protein